MSSDLFAAFGEADQTSRPVNTSQSAQYGLSNKPVPTPLSMNALISSGPAAVEDDDDDDDFGDFEDASKDAEGPSQAELDILKARMGSPIEINRPEYFEGTSDFGGFSNASISHSRNASRQEISHSRTNSQAKAAASLQSQTNIPFRFRTASPPKQEARASRTNSKPVSSSRTTNSTSVSDVPTSRPKPTSNLPFTPKSKPAFSGIEVGAHPFANHMDLLFAGGDDDYDAGTDDLNVDLANDPEAAMAYSKKLIAAQMKEQERQQAQVVPEIKPAPKQTSRSPNKLRKKSQYVPPVDADVMFDVENVSDDNVAEDDDWGDFETSTVFQPKFEMPSVEQKGRATKTKANHAAPTMDLLGMDDTFGDTSDSFNNAWSTEPRREQPKPAPVQPTPLADDPWDDFEDNVPTTVDSATVPSHPNASASNLSHSILNVGSRPKLAPATQLPPATQLQPAPRLPPAPQLPPPNIPPPALLLSIFPSLIAAAQDALFDTLPKLPASQRQEFLSHPATHKLLQSHIALATVLAHTIAGRKLRWKRDHFLAQSMRIGPAAANGKGGMKIAGVDKAEAAKEDREVLDVVRLWRAQVGKVRSAVSASNNLSPSSSHPKLPAVPEISEQMPIKLLKVTEGGFEAPRACGLCGLKREERVAKVDEGVEDSFGEWWVEGVGMHVGCWEFWEEQRRKLVGR